MASRPARSTDSLDDGADFLVKNGFPADLPPAFPPLADTPFSLAVKRALKASGQRELTPPQLLPLIPPEAWPPKTGENAGFLALLRTGPGIVYTTRDGDRGARSVFVSLLTKGL